MGGGGGEEKGEEGEVEGKSFHSTFILFPLPFQTQLTCFGFVTRSLAARFTIWSFTISSYKGGRGSPQWEGQIKETS